jgi:cysteine desulfurase
MNIYLDYAATTPVDKKVLKAMLPYFSEKFGNAMSLHSFGQLAGAAVEKARQQVADFLNCRADEIIFTSGATESNNLALKGIVKKYYFGQKKNNLLAVGEKPHFISTSFEHPCVANTLEFLEKSGQIEVTYLPVSEEGIVALESLEKAIRPNTILVSVMYVNNEIGTVQPIAEMGRLIESINKKRGEKDNKILFHTDATQAINYFNCDVQKLKIDMLSLSGHKIYGPKGVGVLFLRQGTGISRIQDGGEQENDKRAGTHNVPGIVGLGEAIKQVRGLQSAAKNKETAKLRDYLIKRVLKEIPEVVLNGSKTKRSPNNANFIFKNVEGESLLLMLSKSGIACSTGSACSSHSLSPSHVLMALGIRPEDAHGSLRMSLGKYTTKKEIDHTVAVLKKAVLQLRKVAGNILREFK